MTKRATVIVLGDVGHSPRMQLHCLSLAAAQWDVTFVGYKGSRCRPALEEHPRIRQRLLVPPNFEWLGTSALGWALSAILRLVWLTCALLWALWEGPAPDVWLVQTPPAVPTLPLLRVVRALRGGRLVVDWHNDGAALLALRPAGKRWRPLYRWAERWGGQGGHAHLSVTAALRAQLSQWHLTATVLYDRPPRQWHRLDATERGLLWERLGSTLSPSRPLWQATAEGPRDAPDRPAVVVSSTSWTADEDFAPLLTALTCYDLRAQRREAPPLAMIITGKGPLRSHWEQQLRALSFQCVTWQCVWLAAEDYPLLLGAADVGVSLHQSAAGVDLPMKVVDMFGCGLPVCAVDFRCLGELVQHRRTGLVFRSGEELADQLVELLEGFPREENSLIKTLRKNIEEWRKETWENNWNEVALPIFESFTKKNKSD